MNAAESDQGKNGPAGQDPHVLVYTVDGQRYGLSLSCVQRVYPFAETVSAPDTPPAVLGLLRIGDQVVPVVDMRRKLQRPPSLNDLDDRLILTQVGPRPVALRVDAVPGVELRQPEEWVAPDEVLPGWNGLQGVLRCKDGLLLIHDLARFLSLEEQTVPDEFR